MEKKKVRLTQAISREITAIKSTLDAEKAVLDRIKTHKARAIELLKEGYVIEGYQVQASFSNRVWSPKVTPEMLLKEFKKFLVKKSNIMVEIKPTMKSPAQLEKYFIEDKEAMEKLQDFTTRKVSGDKIIKA